jgi:hypothetical protein
MRSERASRRAASPTPARTRPWLAVLAAICAAQLTGCLSVVSGVPSHCKAIDELHNLDLIDDQKMTIFSPNEDTGRATRFIDLAERIDYLEARCVGINAFRGEGGDR